MDPKEWHSLLDGRYPPFQNPAPQRPQFQSWFTRLGRHAPLLSAAANTIVKIGKEGFQGLSGNSGTSTLLGALKGTGWLDSSLEKEKKAVEKVCYSLMSLLLFATLMHRTSKFQGKNRHLIPLSARIPELVPFHKDEVSYLPAIIKRVLISS